MTEQYSFPYSINPLCKGCSQLHEDREEDNIKKWCNFSTTEDCLVLRTYKKD